MRPRQLVWSTFILVSSASVVYPQTTAYSRSKRRCETIVREQDALRYTIVRPTLVYETRGGEEFLRFVASFGALSPWFFSGR